MKFTKLVPVVLLLITLAAFAIRMYQVDSIPPGVNRDEASIGYTAYSLLKTGKDEYGIPWPLSIQSFGDWKLPLYIYLTIPSIALFGLNEFAVRFVSVIAGTATVLLTYFLVRQLFPKLIWLPLFGSLLLAISPWHIHFSRVGSEANLAGFFTTLGLVLFFLARRHAWLIFLSVLSFSATMFTYHGNHIFTPLMVAGVAVLYRSDIRKNRYMWLSIGLFAVLTIFVFSLTLAHADSTKFAGIHILSDISNVHERIDMPRAHHGLSSFSVFFHNKVVLGSEAFLKNYVRAFSPEFLYFAGGGNHAHNIPNVGNAYLFELPFFFFAIVLLIRKKSREHVLLLFWLAIAPLAASITKDAPHSARMFAILPAIPIIVAYGVHETFRRWNGLLVQAFVWIVFVFSAVSYMDAYFVHFPVLASRDWGIGYKQVYEYLIQKQDSYNRIVFTRPQDSPYIFWVFYSKYDPAAFQKNVQRYPPTSDGFSHVLQLDHIEFRPPVYNDDVTTYGLLLVEWTMDLPKPIRAEKVMNDIRGSDGEPHFSIVSWEDKPKDDESDKTTTQQNDNTIK